MRFGRKNKQVCFSSLTFHYLCINHLFNFHYMLNQNEHLPAAFEKRMRAQLGAEAEDFFLALQLPSPVSIRMNPGKWPLSTQLFPEIPSPLPVPWCEEGKILNKRPIFTLDPCLHGGAYYVQEASSMFLKQIFQQILPQHPVRVLDLCAAPGGKSTLIASMLNQDSLLVANEVIRSRATILKENLIKWGQSNVVVTNNDPADFQHFEGAFDFIVVDAPCSGEGMFRKDPTAIQEWSESNLQLCSERQKRILADIWPCLKPGGKLIYSTCTYNPNENETILDWLVEEWQAESIPVTHSFAGIMPATSRAYGYHFYPHKISGEGFFIGVVQKNEGHSYMPRKTKKQQSTHLQIPALLFPYIQHPEEYIGYTNGNHYGIIPQTNASFIKELDVFLRVLYKGCEIAEINHQKIKLLPELALWQGINKEACFVYETDLHTALTFLHKEDIPAIPVSTDWILVSYQGIGLGWCKNLGNRLNNYYPKEWRIKMDIHKTESNELYRS